MTETKFYRKSLFGITFSIGFRPALALRLVRDDEEGTLHIGLLLADLFITSERWAWDGPYMSSDLDYGFSFHNGAFYTNWGPDDSTTLRAFYPYGQWHHRNDLHAKTERGEHPYTYRWAYRPEVQHVTAKVEESAQVWQWKVWGLALPIFRRRASIWCEFSEELGNGKNDWKGGTVGAGFEIEPGQAWADAYQQMQVKQTFCRAKWA